MDSSAPVFGSKWEENIYIALVEAKIEFDYQVPYFGGRSQRGGTVIDFVIEEGRLEPIALYVDGPHWHQKQRDAYETILRRKLEQRGFRVLAVEDESETLEGAKDWVKKNL